MCWGLLLDSARASSAPAGALCAPTLASRTLLTNANFLPTTSQLQRMNYGDLAREQGMSVGRMLGF